LDQINRAKGRSIADRDGMSPPFVFEQRFRTMGDKLANKKKKAKADARPAKPMPSSVSDNKAPFAAKGTKPAK
jgi:hypothetical protein